MANYTITKRENKKGLVYLARVREISKGTVTFNQSKTFHSKAAATKWAKATQNKIESNSELCQHDLLDCTLESLIDAYIDRKQASNKPIRRTALYSYRQIKGCRIAKLLVSRITSKDIIDFALERRAQATKPGPSTIAIDISCVRKVLKIANSLFNIRADDNCVIMAYPALHDLKLISRSSIRDRRLQPSEFSMLIRGLKQRESHHCCKIPFSDIFEFSILTCLRVGEVCKLRWEDLDIDQRSIIVRDRKNPNGSIGNNSVLPLLGKSLDIIKSQPKSSILIFPFNYRSVTAGFQRTRDKLNLKDIRYHDLRREGASRLIEAGYSIEETARITGHKDLKILWQIYVQINPSHFIRKS